MVVALGLAGAGAALALAPQAAALGAERSPEAERAAAALAWLAPRIDASLAPMVAEAADASGHAIEAWPSPEDPVAARLEVPAGEALMPKLRPLRALGLERQTEPADSHLPDPIRAAFDGMQYGDARLANDDIWSLRALHTWGQLDADADAAATWLLAQQHASGGWAWRVGGAPDVDTTGMAMVALAEANRLDAAAAGQAVAYLGAPDASTGGWGTAPGHTANCDSTVWAVRALDAAADVGAPVPTAARAAAWAFLAGLRAPDGSYAYVPGGPPNAMCTAEAATLDGDAAMGLVRGPDPPPSRQAPGGPAGVALAILLGSLAAKAAAGRARDPTRPFP